MSIPFQAVLRDNEADRFKWSVKKMKRRSLISLCVCAIAAGGLLVGCSDDAAKSGVLKVGASPVPHADILKAAQPMLAKEGVKLEVIEFTDYVQPNMALADKELDANFFQHKPYLDNFAKERKLQLESLVAVHIEPMGVYSKKVKDVKAVADGAKVAIPNDPTNGGRALLLLAKAGVISRMMIMAAAILLIHRPPRRNMRISGYSIPTPIRLLLSNRWRTGRRTHRRNAYPGMQAEQSPQSCSTRCRACTERLR